MGKGVGRKEVKGERGGLVRKYSMEKEWVWGNIGELGTG